MPPHQMVQIFFEGDQYDHDFKTKAFRNYNIPEVEQYIQRKLKFPTKGMRLVDWKILTKSNDLLSKPARNTRSKFLYRWKFNSEQEKRLYKRQTLFSLCFQTKEDQAHIYACT